MKFKETTYKGLNYGAESSNIDIETGVRYGVISANKLSSAICDVLEPIYECSCPDCGAPMKNNEPPEDLLCEACGYKGRDESEFYPEEPSWWAYEENNLFFMQDEYNDIIIFKSPFVAYAQFCSPCMPGACNLESPLAEDSRDRDNLCYALDETWFEGNEAPYDYFKLEDILKWEQRKK